MKTPDTSVLVAAFATWHERHDVAVSALTGAVRLIAHAATETYAVLTRLPPPHRAPPDVVAAFLTSGFSGPLLVLPAAAHAGLIARLPAIGVTGGAAYDALIGATALHAKADLLSLDRRAASAYEAVGTSVVFLT